MKATPTLDTVRLVVASQNPGKLREIRTMLSAQVHDAEHQISDMKAWNIADVVENGATFQDNALLKARTVAQKTGLPSLADDSGLAVDILGGSPGIFSARWSGRHGDDHANQQLLLAQLRDVEMHNRQAQFICVVALVLPSPAGTIELTARGVVQGSLLTEPRGDQGFGYDALFRPIGSELSYAQMDQARKNRDSHRRRALASLLPEIAGRVPWAKEPGPTAR